MLCSKCTECTIKLQVNGGIFKREQCYIFRLLLNEKDTDQQWSWMDNVCAWYIYIYMHNECVYTPKKRVCANLLNSRIGKKSEAGII